MSGTQKKNGVLTPFKIKPKSNKKVWWICNKCGYEWRTSPAHRVVDKTGCPKCVVIEHRGGGSHLVIKGVNDLKTLEPLIASEWNEELNKGINLDNIAVNSNREVYWTCSICGNIYKDKIVYRTQRNHGCNICKERAWR